jgi:hypothetical protein
MQLHVRNSVSFLAATSASNSTIDLHISVEAGGNIRILPMATMWIHGSTFISSGLLSWEAIINEGRIEISEQSGTLVRVHRQTDFHFRRNKLFFSKQRLQGNIVQLESGLMQVWEFI